MLIAISDTHIGTQASERDELLQFLKGPANSADELLIIGDFIDYWRRGIEPVMAENADIISEVLDLNPTVIAGNHDWRLVDTNTPFDVRKRYSFEKGGREFEAIHGHQYDPANASPVSNRALCLTSDKQGQAISNAYGSARDTTGLTFSREPFFIRPNLTQIAHLTRPDILREKPDRVERINSRAALLNSRFVLFGHTHVPGVTEEYANCGSWTSGQKTYVHVSDEGEVSLERFEG